MLEIIALIALTNKIGSIAEQKGHKSGGYKALTVLLWIGGEFIGAFFGAAMASGDESAICTVYLIAIIGAAIGAGIAFAIVNSLPDQGPSPAQLLTSSGYSLLQPSAAASFSAENPVEKLKKFKGMLDSGVITKAEYDAKKAEILSKM
jgi:uncharacterized membrane protein YeaQ/YmgE (transglycosylase-associated protein family)